MIWKMFSIRDSKSEMYNRPFFKSTHGEAERAFRELVNDDKSTLMKFPEDFDLYYLGEFDDNLGTFRTLETPQHVIKAVHCVQRPSASAQV